MKRKSLAAVAAGLMAVGSLFVGTVPADAASPTMHAYITRPTEFGWPSVAGKVNGMCDVDITITVVDIDTRIVVGNATVPSTGGAFDTGALSQSGGEFEAIAHCASYGTPPAPGGESFGDGSFAKFILAPAANPGPWTITESVTATSLINITPETFTQGQVVEVTSDGFAPGETVSMVMHDSNNKKIDGWEPTAVADANGNVTFNVAFPYKGLPMGTYYLSMLGESGHTAIGAMYWGQPSDDDTPTPAPPSSPTPEKVPTGLPSTGR